MQYSSICAHTVCCHQRHTPTWPSRSHAEESAAVVRAAAGERAATRVPGDACHGGVVLTANELRCPPLLLGLVSAHADALTAAADRKARLAWRPLRAERRAVQPRHHHLRPPLGPMLRARRVDVGLVVARYSSHCRPSALAQRRRRRRCRQAQGIGAPAARRSSCGRASR